VQIINSFPKKKISAFEHALIREV